MTDAHQRLARYRWSQVPGIGARRLAQLEQAFGDAAAAWAAPAAALAALPGFGPMLLTRIEATRSWPAPKVPPRVLLAGDPALPRAMAALPHPPIHLFWAGRGSLWPRLGQRRAIAVVGSRGASPQGRGFARRLGAALGAAGWPVVSGLAEGIDAAVHRGCLAAGGAPIGVLGTPLERVYPLHHRELQEQVQRQGLLLSEQSPGATGRASAFAARNRLIVALVAGVVLVECPAVSGALAAATQAWDDGLPLWVVPADVDREGAAGSNRWLALGASPLCSPDALVALLGPGPCPPARGASCHGQAAQAASPLQHDLLRACGQPCTLQALATITRQPLAGLLEQLLGLEKDSQLLRLPGPRWVRCA